MIPGRGRLFGLVVIFWGFVPGSLKTRTRVSRTKGGEWHLFQIESVLVRISAMEDSDAFQHLQLVRPVCPSSA